MNRSQRMIGWLGVAALVAAAGVGASRPAAAGETLPTLVSVTAAHGSTFDRVTFQFEGGVPNDVSVEYVEELIADGSGAVVPVPGRAILGIRMEGAVAHTEAGVSTVPRRTAYALPNVMVAINNGDFEGVVNYGLGLAKPTDFVWRVVPERNRVVVEPRAAFGTVLRRVYFQNSENFQAGVEPYVKGVWRPVIPGTPATAVMDRLFAGPTTFEYGNGLRLIRSRASAYSNLSITDQIARVRLRGGCGSGGSTFTIANEIMPTLRQFDNVDWVKIYGPGGQTGSPTGNTDSIPTCLEP